MPIEIKELIVRTTIETDKDEQKSSTSAPVDIAHIISEVVEQVIEILKQNAER